jgi:small-conductance mechanosensitive channel
LSELLSSSEPWVEAAVTFGAGVILAALLAAAVNLVMRRLLDDHRRGGRGGGARVWVVAAVALLISMGRLAEPGATETGLAAAAARLLSALPDLILGLLVVVLGWAVAVAVRALVSQLLQRVRPSAAELVAGIVYWAILVLAILIAAEQVGIEIGLLRNLLLIVIGGLVFATAVALGLGTRDLVAEVVAGRHVERIVAVGDDIEVAGVRGVVTGLGHASVRLASPGGGEVELPNGLLLDEPVVIHARSA